MVELIRIAVLWSLCPSKIHLPSQIFSLFLYLYVMKSTIKNTFKVKWVKFFFPQMSASWCDIKWRCKQTNKKKIFFVTKLSFERCLCVGNVSITHRGSFVLLSFYGELLVIYRFSSNFACLYLGTSHFGHPPVFRN